MSDAVEWDDVQALVARGFPNRRSSAHILLEVKDPAAARKWLGDMLNGKTPLLATTVDVDGIHDPRAPGDPPVFQIAFTYPGLQAIELPEDVLSRFTGPFVEGMAPQPEEDFETTRRAGLLGDVDLNHESNWSWGGLESDVPAAQIHLLLMIYAVDAGRVKAVAEEVLSGDTGLAPAGGGEPFATAATICNRLEMREEEPGSDKWIPIDHFGYFDGVSQPMIMGLERAKRALGEDRESPHKKNLAAYRQHAVAAGEFVLGYPNERKIITPWVQQRGFGKNGSYLVVRQLEQHVGAFNAFVTKAAKALSNRDDLEAKEDAAALLMGRRRDNRPLSPEYEEGGHLSDFGFAARDPAGMICPIGAHARRANPRDSRENPPETALRLAKRHRIMRRGRIYGEQIDNDNFDVEANEGRGLLFLCVNADIAQQFEFIQQSWLNNRSFRGLLGEVDPITSPYEVGEAPFTIQGNPRPTKVKRDRQLITTKGGGYFFVPGVRALRLIASNFEEG